MNGPISETANAQYYLNVYVNSGSGSVSGSGWYPAGSVATVSETPATGYHFVDWTNGNTGSTYSFTMDSPNSIGANFEINTYTVTFQSSPVEGAPVTVDGNSETTPYSIVVDYGTTVTCSYGSSFSGGSGVRYINPSPSSGSFTVTSTTTITASYTTQYYFNVYVNSGSGSVSGGGWYNSGSLAFSVPVYIQKRVANDEERSLEGFVRDITEYRKSGYDITRAIRKLSIEGRYTPAFTGLLKRVAASLALGSRLPEINVKANSWVVKQIFFLLGEVEDSGGGSPKELEAIHTFVEKFALAKSMVKSRMRIYEMLAMATPAGLAVLIFVMGTFIKVLGSGGLALGGLISTSVPPSLISASYVMVIVSAVFMALSAGVASDFTVKNMWRVALSVLLASVVIFALTTFGGAITSLLPTSL
ncbi:MAG: hypothetical protein QXG05_05050 [Nitrososphaerota archaeon]